MIGYWTFSMSFDVKLIAIDNNNDDVTCNIVLLIIDAI